MTSPAPSATTSPGESLSWFAIIRLGLVQAAIGSIVVLTTSTLNRLMVVEFLLPAVLPGILVALHYGVQITRPNWGFRSDKLGNRTPWILGGMAILAVAGYLAALGVTLFASSYALALGVSFIAYTLIGFGVGASGTSLLALLATASAAHRRAAAATITWLMMILGIALTAGVVGGLLEPYSDALLLRIVALVCAGAFAVTFIATWRIERGLISHPQPQAPPFMVAMREVWAETKAREFTIFVFLSMSAFFMQELIMEPFAGLVFDFTPGMSTTLSGMQNGGVFTGMLLVGIASTGLRIGSLRMWVVIGCVGSAATLAGIAFMGLRAALPLAPAVVTLGLFNGVFAVAAIASMMQLAGEGRASREGTRMGLWGASQAIAAGFGGLLGASLVDIGRVSGLPIASAYGSVFLIEAALFLVAAMVGARILSPATPRVSTQQTILGE